VIPAAGRPGLVAVLALAAVGPVSEVQPPDPSHDFRAEATDEGPA
jgi:hypothetical protein